MISPSRSRNRVLSAAPIFTSCALSPTDRSRGTSRLYRTASAPRRDNPRLQGPQRVHEARIRRTGMHEPATRRAAGRRVLEQKCRPREVRCGLVEETCCSSSPRLIDDDRARAARARRLVGAYPRPRRPRGASGLQRIQVMVEQRTARDGEQRGRPVGRAAVDPAPAAKDGLHRTGRMRERSDAGLRLRSRVERVASTRSPPRNFTITFSSGVSPRRTSGRRANRPGSTRPFPPPVRSALAEGNSPRQRALSARGIPIHQLKMQMARVLPGCRAAEHLARRDAVTQLDPDGSRLRCAHTHRFCPTSISTWFPATVSRVIDRQATARCCPQPRLSLPSPCRPGSREPPSRTRNSSFVAGSPLKVLPAESICSQSIANR